MSKKKAQSQLEQDIENVNIAVTKFCPPPNTSAEIPIAIFMAWQRLVARLQGKTDEEPTKKVVKKPKKKPAKESR